VTKYAYNPMGQITERKLPNSTKTTYEYNTLGNLLHLTHFDISGKVNKLSYQYDPVGNKIQINKITWDHGNGKGLIEKNQYEYDPLNRLTAVLKDSHMTGKYSYDAFGNRTKLEDIPNHDVTDYEYDSLNRLIKISSQKDGIKEMSYDPRGNLTSIDSNGRIEKSFTWGADNKMAGSVCANGGKASYVYDGFGQRIKSTWDIIEKPGDPVKHIETNYLLDSTKPFDNLLMTYGSGDKTQRFIWGNEMISSHSAKVGDNILGNPIYHLHDELHSPIRLLDENGNSVSQFEYDEFGTSTGRDNFVSMFGYTGYQSDPVTDLCYAQARYYMPLVGRFTSEDPIRSGGNWYVYCRNNPLKFFDPLGLEESDVDNNNQDYKFNYSIDDFNQGNFFTKSGTRYETNCYAFAFDLIFDPLTGEKFHTLHDSYPMYAMQPGSISNNFPYCDYLFKDKNGQYSRLLELINLDAKALGKSFTPYDKNNDSGGYVVALVVRPKTGDRDADYHWYRQNSDGSWDHKPGETKAQHVDLTEWSPGFWPWEWGNRNYITLEEYAAKSGYTDFVGYYYIK